MQKDLRWYHDNWQTLITGTLFKKVRVLDNPEEIKTKTWVCATLIIAILIAFNLLETLDERVDGLIK